MGLSVILVECDVVSPAGDPATLRFSDRAIYPMSPTDPGRPNMTWDDRLIEPPTLRRSLFEDLQTLTPGLGVGLMSLANADRALDVYQGWVWGEVRVWRWTYGTPFAAAARLMTGPAAGAPTYSVQSTRPGRVVLTLFDYRLELERPLQSNAYSGANDGVAVFYEGAIGIKGRLKPIALGDLMTAHVPAVPINQSFGAYQLHDGRMQNAVDGGHYFKVFDRGYDADYVLGGDLSDSPGLEPTFPTIGLSPAHVYWFTRLGLFKFNGQPVGQVAFGVMGASPGPGLAAPTTAGPLVAWVLAKAGVPAERIDASIPDYPSTAVLGAYATDAISAWDMVGWLARSAAMAVLPDRLGQWKALTFAPPAAVAIHSLGSADILQLEADEGVGLGAGEFSVGYDRVWTTYRRDNLFHALHDTPEETRLATEYRYTLDEDDGYKARHPGSWSKLKIETALRRQSDAEALTQTLKGLFGLRPDGRPRRAWRITLEMTDDVLAVQLGATVEVDAPEWGVGDRYILIAEEPMRPRRDLIIWTVWG